MHDPAILYEGKPPRPECRRTDLYMLLETQSQVAMELLVALSCILGFHHMQVSGGDPYSTPTLDRMGYILTEICIKWMLHYFNPVTYPTLSFSCA